MFRWGKAESEHTEASSRPAYQLSNGRCLCLHHNIAKKKQHIAWNVCLKKILSHISVYIYCLQHGALHVRVSPWQAKWITRPRYFFFHAALWLDTLLMFSDSSTALRSLLVSPGQRHYRTAARLGSHEPPPAQRWPGSTRLSLPPWAGHLGGEEGRKAKREERGSESVMWGTGRDDDIEGWWQERGKERCRGRGVWKKERRFEERRRLVMREELKRWYPRRPDENLR